MAGITVTMVKQSQHKVTPAAIPVLLTRPMEQSLRFQAALEHRFGGALRSIISPLLRPVFVPCEIPDRDYRAVLFTSEAAVNATAQLTMVSLPKKALCVGTRTADAASAAGFDATSAKGDVEALGRLVMAKGIAGPLLYLHGQETRGNLVETLVSAGLETDSVTIYEQKAQLLSAEATAQLCNSGPVLVPIFSPRSASLLTAALPDGMQATLAIAALSNAVAAQSPKLKGKTMRIAATPDADAMLEAVELLLKDLSGS